jgi:hypothetical protein
MAATWVPPLRFQLVGVASLAVGSNVHWQLIARGPLRATFNANSQMEALDFRVEEHSEYVPRNFMRESPDLMKSSPGSKALGKRPSQQRNQRPDSLVNNFGVPSSVFQCLEVQNLPPCAWGTFQADFRLLTKDRRNNLTNARPV